MGKRKEQRNKKRQLEKESWSIFSWIISFLHGLFVKPTEIQNIVPNVVNLVTESNNTNKRALLIGSNFKLTQYPLNGCINDLNNIQSWLKTRGFSYITIISDDEELKPTRSTIMNKLVEFLDKNKGSGETLYIHFSGHGTQISASKPSEESDGQDECICTCEGANIDIITDNELNSIIQTKLAPDAILYIIFDCCHSGSMLDLKYTYDNKTDNWLESSIIKETNCGRIIMMSGCVDASTSADALITDNENNKSFQGALTWALLNALETETEIGSVYKKTLQFLIDNQFDQYPLLSTNMPYALTSLYLPLSGKQTLLP